MPAARDSPRIVQSMSTRARFGQLLVSSGHDDGRARTDRFEKGLGDPSHAFRLQSVAEMTITRLRNQRKRRFAYASPSLIWISSTPCRLRDRRGHWQRSGDRIRGTKRGAEPPCHLVEIVPPTRSGRARSPGNRDSSLRDRTFDYSAGLMFWLTRKKLSGSYFALTLARRP